MHVIVEYLKSRESTISSFPRINMNALFFVFIAIVVCSYAQIPCDDAYGAYCPEESGYSVGDCLKRVASEDPSAVSKECIDYIGIHETCREDIDTHCSGKEYTGDLLACLSEWTKPDQLSSTCLTSLPKKKAPKKRKLSATEKKKADKRRK